MYSIYELNGGKTLQQRSAIFTASIMHEVSVSVKSVGYVFSVCPSERGSSSFLSVECLGDSGRSEKSPPFFFLSIFFVGDVIVKWRPIIGATLFDH